MIAVIYRTCSWKYCQFWNGAEEKLQCYHYGCCLKKILLHSKWRYCTQCFSLLLFSVLDYKTYWGNKWGFHMLSFFSCSVILLYLGGGGVKIFNIDTFQYYFPCILFLNDKSLIQVLILSQLFEARIVFPDNKDKIQIRKKKKKKG